MLEELVLKVVREYKPARSILHSIIYLKNGVLLKDWTLALTGVYSERLDSILDELIQDGSIKVCKDGRLTVDECPREGSDLSGLVDEAVKKFLASHPARGL
jgi:uncharacterized protein YwgA